MVDRMRPNFAAVIAIAAVCALAVDALAAPPPAFDVACPDLAGAAKQVRELPAAPKPPENPPHTSHVELSARVGADLDRIAGTARWRYVNPGPTPLDAVHLLLLANQRAEPDPGLSAAARAGGFWAGWQPSATTVGAVRMADGAAAKWSLEEAPPASQTYSLANGVLVVALDAPLPPGEAVELEVDFTTIVPHKRGDAGHFNGDLIWRFGWFPQPRLRTADGWSAQSVWPAFTHRSQVTGPAGYRVVLGGAGASQLQPEGDTPKPTVAEASHAVRSVPLVVSDRLRSYTLPVGDLEIEVHLHPDAAIWDPACAEAARVFVQTRRVLADFQPRYGAYRLGGLKIVELPVSSVSMAADGMVLQSDLFFIYDDVFGANDYYRPYGEVVLAHELAHQWFGLSLGVAFDDANWLSEGMAEYMAQAYATRRFGAHGRSGIDPNPFLIWLLAGQGGALPPANLMDHQVLPGDRRLVWSGWDEPVVQPAESVEHGQASGARWYQKGVIIARSLDAVLGPDGTAALIKRAYTRDAGGVLTVEALIAAGADEGYDLEPWAEHLVRGPGRVSVGLHPEQPVEWGEDATRVRIRRESPIALPVPIEVRRGDAVYQATVPPDRDTVTVPGGGEPISVIVDPTGVLPDDDRWDNREGGSTEWSFPAPRPRSGVHTIGVNPLPLQRLGGLVGLSVVGTGDDRWRWGLGAGVLGFGFIGEDEPDVSDEVVGTEVSSLPTGFVGTYGAQGEASYAFDPSHRLFGFASGTLSRGGGLDQDRLTAGLVYGWSHWSALPVGVPGRVAWPFTQVSIGPAVSWRRPGPDSRRTAFDGGETAERLSPQLLASLVRDSRPTLGLVTALNTSGGLVDGVRGGDPYAIGQLQVDGQWPLGWAWLYGGVTGLVDTPSTQVDDRPMLARLPVSATTLISTAGLRPYDWGGEAALGLRVPLLSDRRIKNLATLNVLIFDDLSLDFDLAGAWGGVWYGDPDRGAIDPAVTDPRAEAAARLVLGFSWFDTSAVTFGFGAGMVLASPDAAFGDLQFLFTLGVEGGTASAASLGRGHGAAQVGVGHRAH